MRGIICGALMALTVTAAGAAEDPRGTKAMLFVCKLTQADLMSAPIDQALMLSSLKGQCKGTIFAIHALFDALRATKKPNDTWCADIPESVTNLQLVDIVLKFGETHPEFTRYSFDAFVIAALGLTFPCKK